MKKALSIILMGLAVTLSGCTLPGQKPVQNPAQDNVACTMEAKICPDGSAVGRSGPNCEFAECPEANTQIANPASVNCKEKGGTSEIITAGDDSQSSICKFPDGTQCEEWALFRNECKPGMVSVTSNNIELKSIDSVWNQYTNNKIGFTLKVLKKTLLNGNYSNVEIMESGNVVFIFSRTAFDYAKIQQRANSNLSDIEKVRGVPWAILVQTVNNDKELDTLIKAKYGSGCSLGAKTSSSQANIYNVEIKGDGLDMDKTKCPVNFVTSIKYSPTLHKAALWDRGQDVVFIANDSLVVDSIMADSFKFTK